MTLDLSHFFFFLQASQLCFQYSFQLLQKLLNAHVLHLEQPIVHTFYNSRSRQLLKISFLRKNIIIIVSNWGTEAKYSELDETGKIIRQIIKIV